MTRVPPKASLFLLLTVWLPHLAVAQTRQADANPSVAIFGDSISTGAGTHPNLEFDSFNIWQVMGGEIPVAAPADLPPPQIIYPGPAEFRSGVEWFFSHYMIRLAATFLNTEQFTWGYLVSSHWDVDPRQLYLVAENGAQMRDFPKQLDRLLHHTKGKVPDKLFLFYTGNDLCASNTPEQVAADLRRGLRYLMRVGKLERPVDVFVLSYLGLVQLIASESIAAKPVRAFGEETTCGKLRENYFQPQNDTRPQPTDPVYGVFRRLMPPNPVGLCPQLFYDRGQRADARVTEVANLVRAYRREMAAVVKDVDQLAAEMREQTGHLAPRFYFLEGPGELEFAGDDIAADCFHLSVQGQKKIAEIVIGDLGDL